MIASIKSVRVFLIGFLLAQLAIPSGQAGEPIQTSDGQFVPVIHPDQIHQDITTISHDSKDSPLSPIPVTITPDEKQKIVERLQDLEEEVKVAHASPREVLLEQEAAPASYSSAGEPRTGQSAEEKKVQAPYEKTSDGKDFLQEKINLTNTAKSVLVKNAIENLKVFQLVQVFIDSSIQQTGLFFKTKYLDAKKNVQDDHFNRAMKEIRHFSLYSFSMLPFLFQPGQQSADLQGASSEQKPAWAALGDRLLAGESNLPQGDYVVLESIMIGKEMAAIHFLMNPPRDLHPFLRFLFYERFMTPEVVAYYLSARQRIMEMYEKAKSGKGKIRYKGKIYDAYLPLPDEFGGLYELVISLLENKNKAEQEPLQNPER